MNRVDQRGNPGGIAPAVAVRVLARTSAFIVLAGVSAWLIASPAHAADAGENGRFTILPFEDGALRLDTRTGAVSLCTVDTDGLQCRAGADERAALEAEINRLSNENAQLRARSDAGANAGSAATSGGRGSSGAATTPASPATPQPPAAGPDKTAPEASPAPHGEAMPDERTMNQALDFAERFMRRMMRILRDEPKDERT